MNADAPGEYRNRSIETNRSFSENAQLRGWGLPVFVTIFFRQRYSTAVMWIPITKQLFCNCLFTNLFALVWRVEPLLMLCEWVVDA